MSLGFGIEYLGKGVSATLTDAKVMHVLSDLSDDAYTQSGKLAEALAAASALGARDLPCRRKGFLCNAPIVAEGACLPYGKIIRNASLDPV